MNLRKKIALLSNRCFRYFNKAKKSNAVVISVYFNPKKNPYRLDGFLAWRRQLIYLGIEYRVLELSLDGSFELPKEDKNISRLTDNNLNLSWLKESLLNILIKNLLIEKKAGLNNFKYVFWSDADIIFYTPEWLEKSLECFDKGYNIVQPFELAVHLPEKVVSNEYVTLKNESIYQYVTDKLNKTVGHKPLTNISNDSDIEFLNKVAIEENVWSSFGHRESIKDKNYKIASNNPNYHYHGHVGFIWGTFLDYFNKISLFDTAFIGGADHIMAHASSCMHDNKHNHPCINKIYKSEGMVIQDWSNKFNKLTQGLVTSPKGIVVCHYYHGDIDKRQYYKRQTDINNIELSYSKKQNGLYEVHNNDFNQYFSTYYGARETFIDTPENTATIDDSSNSETTDNIKDDQRNNITYMS